VLPPDVVDRVGQVLRGFVSMIRIASPE